MTDEAKDKINEATRAVHVAFTIVGIPVIMFMVGDMYLDFKKVRDNDIRQDEKITRNREDIQTIKASVESMGNYVWRGVK